MSTEDPYCKPDWAGPHVQPYHSKVLTRELCEEYNEIVMCIELDEPISFAAVLDHHRQVAEHLRYGKFDGRWQAADQDWLMAAVLENVDAMTRQFVSPQSLIRTSKQRRRRLRRATRHR